MGWLILPALIVFLLIALLGLWLRRAELRAMSRSLAALAEAKAKGSHQARLQYPHVDLSRCIGCGTCVKACPEEGVLELIHGQAAVVHGARCVGHGLCAQACPVGAIDLTLGDLQDRNDIPAVTEKFEVRGTKGLFLAGEVTGFALIRTAITHGVSIVNEVSRRLAEPMFDTNRGEASQGKPLDLCIVGAGPAGVAASLQAKKLGMTFVTLEQSTIGGTVSHYPRRKLVMTQPVDLPLYGRLKRTSYQKEELIELWTNLNTQFELPIQTNQELVGIEPIDGGGFFVHTRTDRIRARFVCLALGRRGTPRKLNVRGEDLRKVAYNLIDAQSYQYRKVLVVGGGDSAIEAALGLSEQPGNEVTLSYRKGAFFRIKARNESRLADALRSGQLRCILWSQVSQIEASSVRLVVRPENGPEYFIELDNDDVFIMVGGTPPFQLLERCGVSFDPSDHSSTPPLAERGTGLMRALFVALVLAMVTLGWAVLYSQYYWVSSSIRPLSKWHEFLRPSSAFGLGCGVLAVALIAANLCYLLRRNWFRWIPGSLTAWMTSHAMTGIVILLLVLLHSAMSPRNTIGGHAFAALGFLVITGAVGRYFYSFVPRAANGTELALEELNEQLARESTEWDRYGRGFGDAARQEIYQLVSRCRWKGNFIHRAFALWQTENSLPRTLRTLRQRGREQGLSDDQVERLTVLAKRAYRTALVSAHYEDLRILLNSWRFFHRWVALLMVLLAAAHIWVALRYGRGIP